MDKHYDTHRIEDAWYETWLETGAFHSDHTQEGEPYCVMIPPPNVTGILHMGHALNNTIQDILARWRRMEGRNVIWMPGTDHAGIATQNVVERALKKEGKSRDDLGRDAFIERVWKWRAEYGGTIVKQLKRLGASCDWERERFTMDEGLSDAVAEVFVRLYEKELIYRANYIINWCPRCHTALSDEESEHQDSVGKLYHLRYPVQGREEGEYIVVATTRPETLLGDTAVAVHPEDERYADLDQKTVILPVLGRELRVIRDEYVDPKFGTGIVKVTPAHDPNDFEMGQRHDLEQINVMNGDGTMNEGAGPYAGMDRFACRRKILEDLEAQDLIEKIEDHPHAVGHCYRCDTVVEPRLSPQWFVKMAPLAEPALAAVKNGDVTFVPGRWTKVYMEWMENIRDWCISRQIWWGHRIPVFTCTACEHEWAAKGRPETCPECGSGDVTQDEDVLDTWFSSWLWPFSTLGWPDQNPDLAHFYPTHDLVTASEIIFFWVARMIMAGYEFMDGIPFDTVYIHGTVRDDAGKKMSKSLGNALDPLDIIKDFSADALRFSLTMLTATGQDVYISKEKFELGRNFGTKLWNASRFIRMQDGDIESPAPQRDVVTVPDLDPALLTADDRHLLGKLDQAVKDCTDALERYRFNDAAHVIYEFLWHQYCDWYIECSKGTLNGDREAARAQVLRIMHYALGTALRLLHPIMPFLTEELWHAMGYSSSTDRQDPSGFIMKAAWPTPLGDEQLAAWGIDSQTLEYVENKHELIRLGRTLRADFGVVPNKAIDYIIKPHDAETAARLEADRDSVAALLKAETLTIDAGAEPEQAMPSSVGSVGTIYMPLAGLLDVEAELKRLSGQLEKVVKGIDQVTRKLSNDAFVTRAPEAVVEQQRQNQKDMMEKRDKIERLMETIRGGSDQ
ncbi:MAG: valine--tRNA ligase [Kiritimatiellia bacterium]|jgi:valyl-tRNA synthetase|nr:valine--tRNA ligase [Kiritimatiellia bacterium]MDP6630852.1 valine--tRNA ligase [Kiritimatiellia bacterium]MDP6811269.1 valine--tRNA ligase [Kiritimatiellia bacterium]MDP7024117.1 valine--tRNA ligase [Kiritimatiellia bacterium]